MKKTVLILLIGTLLLMSAGCVKKEIPAAPAATQSNVPTATESAADPVTELCCIRDYGRLYAVPLDGSVPRLLADEYCNDFVRRGTTLVGAFSDGTVRRTDLKTGEWETLVTVEDGNVNQLGLYDGGIIYISYTTTEGSQPLKYDFVTKKITQLFDDYNFWQYTILDNILYYSTYGNENDFYVSQLVAFDLSKDTELWRKNTESIFNLYLHNGSVYVCEGDSNQRWYVLNTADGSRTTTEDIPGKPGESDLLYMGSGGALVEKNVEYGWDPYFVTANGETRLDFAIGIWGSTIVLDQEGDYALLRTSDDWSTTIFDEVWDYYPQHYYVINGANGSYTNLLTIDAQHALFSKGDFPVFDCSTARKPVVRDIYQLFCLETQYGGASPVCNTTHGAWTAIAERTSDIALLAAPTEEEQSYLSECGVEVEMKLYGGDGLVFIGNTEIGVTDLSLENLRGIYRGEITNWSELGGVDHAIRVLYRDDQSGSQRLFENLLWKGEDVPDFQELGFERMDEMSTIVSECVYDPYTIGYSIMTYLGDVFDEETLQCFSVDGVAATADTVKSSEYPLGTRGYVVIRADEAADSPARRLYDWFGCPLCDDILSFNSITPLHESSIQEVS